MDIQSELERMQQKGFTEEDDLRGARQKAEANPADTKEQLAEEYGDGPNERGW